MGTWMRFCGVAGLVIFLFGLVFGFLTGAFSDWLVLSHIIFGLALVVVWFLLFGMNNLGQTGQALTGRKARFGYLFTSYAAIFVGVLVVLNIFTVRHDQRWDLTEQGVYSLASQSIKVIEGLKKPLKLVGFTGISAGDDNQIKELFKLYSYYNPGKVRTEIVDPRKQPTLIDSYEMKPGNLIYLEYGDGPQKGVSRINEMSEEALTNAILKLARGESKKIYYVQGHGEPALDDASPGGLKDLVGAIGDENLTVEGIVLAQQQSVPEDAAALILCSPKKLLLPDEKAQLTSYLERGGRLILLTDPRTTADISEIASKYKIEVSNNVVIDQIQRLFAGPALGAQPVIRDYGSHAITNGLNKNSVTIFNIASTVKRSAKAEEGESFTELVKSSPSAWGESNLSLLFDSPEPSAVLEKDDLTGPVSMAVAYEKKIKDPAAQKKDDAAQVSDEEAKFDKAARLVIFGDSDWILNANLAVYSNRDLFLNSLNWVLGEEGGISIRPRMIKANLEPVLSDQLKSMFFASLIIPELILLFGFWVWWRRKSLSALGV